MPTQLDYFLSVHFADIDDTETVYVAVPDAGEIAEIAVAPAGTVAAETAITGSINGTAITGGVVTVAAGFAGDTFSCTPTGANDVIEGDVISLASNGEAGISGEATAVITIRRQDT